MNTIIIYWTFIKGTRKPWEGVLLCSMILFNDLVNDLVQWSCSMILSLVISLIFSLVFSLVFLLVFSTFKTDSSFMFSQFKCDRQSWPNARDATASKNSQSNVMLQTENGGCCPSSSILSIPWNVTSSFMSNCHGQSQNQNVEAFLVDTLPLFMILKLMTSIFFNNNQCLFASRS